MKLADLKKEQKAIIEKVDCNDELKQRFYSFGIFKGATVFVENISFARNTIEINVDDTSIALRVEEAKTITVTLKD
jgi:ferrous iron transport protein A